jgi:hypothetical protein
VIDVELGLIVESFKSFSLIPPESKKSDSSASIVSTSEAPEADISDAKKVLAFTAHLLQNSYNKEVYNSAEVRKSTFRFLYLQEFGTEND